MGNQSPTQSITCPHGSLLPELAGARARRAAVPPVVWRHLQTAWKQACIERRAKPKKAAKQKSPARSTASPGAELSDRYNLFGRPLVITVLGHRAILRPNYSVDVLQCSDAVRLCYALMHYTVQMQKVGVLQTAHSSCRERQLNEREAAVALREQRVGSMDSDLLATFGDLPNGNSSASKEVWILPVTITHIREETHQ